MLTPPEQSQTSQEQLFRQLAVARLSGLAILSLVAYFPRISLAVLVLGQVRVAPIPIFGANCPILLDVLSLHVLLMCNMPFHLASRFPRKWLSRFLRVSSQFPYSADMHIPLLASSDGVGHTMYTGSHGLKLSVPLVPLHPLRQDACSSPLRYDCERSSVTSTAVLPNTKSNAIAQALATKFLQESPALGSLHSIKNLAGMYAQCNTKMIARNSPILARELPDSSLSAPGICQEARYRRMWIFSGHR
jgi:hypothetical protein